MELFEDLAELDFNCSGALPQHFRDFDIAKPLGRLQGHLPFGSREPG